VLYFDVTFLFTPLHEELLFFCLGLFPEYPMGLDVIPVGQRTSIALSAILFISTHKREGKKEDVKKRAMSKNIWCYMEAARIKAHFLKLRPVLHKTQDQQTF